MCNIDLSALERLPSPLLAGACALSCESISTAKIVQATALPNWDVLGDRCIPDLEDKDTVEERGPEFGIYRYHTDSVTDSYPAKYYSGGVTNNNGFRHFLEVANAQCRNETSGSSNASNTCARKFRQQLRVVRRDMLDEYTRILFIDLSVYSMNSDVWSATKMLNTGGP